MTQGRWICAGLVALAGVLSAALWLSRGHRRQTAWDTLSPRAQMAICESAREAIRARDSDPTHADPWWSFLLPQM